MPAACIKVKEIELFGVGQSLSYSGRGSPRNLAVPNTGGFIKVFPVCHLAVTGSGLQVRYESAQQASSHTLFG